MKEKLLIESILFQINIKKKEQNHELICLYGFCTYTFFFLRYHLGQSCDFRNFECLLLQKENKKELKSQLWSDLFNSKRCSSSLF